MNKSYQMRTKNSGIMIVKINKKKILYKTNEKSEHN